MIRAYPKTVGLVALSLLVGCGSTPPPKELLEARTAYQKAQTGQANQVNPAQVHVAKGSLDQAEKSYDDEPGSPETRDRAYIALRKSQLADAQAGMMVAERQREQAQKELQTTQVAMGRKTERELESAKKQLERSQQQLEDERRRTKEALDNLAKMAEVKNDNRGMVITLSGQVLFASGASALLPAAMSALDNVVTALKANPDRSITVEGHTDSQGQRGFNMDLSQKRADSVRQYIISHGLPPEIVKAVGVGPDRPVASNGTAEGRANNRRVEIIVSPPERK
ncbi:OmpA family protein [Pendulispora rubella]|uniref:OmpA family protein n=1 Tax=Pendulispora rubella TaxID=2741070 RepID=A0ABZ2L9B9_9BACT